MQNHGLKLELGVKTDPIQNRYSFDWLFNLCRNLEVRHLQLGTFFELYALPDAFFRDLKRRADDQGIAFTSVFTAHRELGGFFRKDGDGWTAAARGSFERLIDVAAMIGASSVGSNPGAVLRDRMGTKASGLANYLAHFKELMIRAGDKGIAWLTIEPMSCLAEPPTTPDEIVQMMEDVNDFHRSHPGSARPGYCVDIAHGYADADRKVLADHFKLMRSALPMTNEVHLKNTDAIYNSTFGFSKAERERGIIDVRAVRDFYLGAAGKLPTQTLVGYLEIGGPKLGRDFSDPHLGDSLRDSLTYLRETWLPQGAVVPPKAVEKEPIVVKSAEKQVKVAPSIMCADLLNLERHLSALKSVGAADLLHLDVMDGRFAPNLTLGLTLIEQLRPTTDIPLDVHLMVEDPEPLIRELLRIGVDRIAIHAEAVTHLDRTVNQLRDAGVKAGVAINPATPLSVLDYVLDEIDFVLVMTVNPGFAGQKLCSSALRKIADCRRLLEGRPVSIEVDGNVSFANIPAMVAAGADELVAGTSSVFSKANTLAANAQLVREAIAQGLAQRTYTKPAVGPAVGVM